MSDDGDKSPDASETAGPGPRRLNWANLNRWQKLAAIGSVASVLGLLLALGLGWLSLPTLGRGGEGDLDEGHPEVTYFLGPPVERGYRNEDCEPVVTPLGTVGDLEYNTFLEVTSDEKGSPPPTLSPALRDGQPFILTEGKNKPGMLFRPFVLRDPGSRVVRRVCIEASDIVIPNNGSGSSLGGLQYDPVALFSLTMGQGRKIRPPDYDGDLEVRLVSVSKEPGQLAATGG